MNDFYNFVTILKLNFVIKHGTALLMISGSSVFPSSHLSNSSGNHCLSLSYHAKFYWPVADSKQFPIFVQQSFSYCTRLFLNSLQCHAGWESLVLTHPVNKVSSLHCPDESHSLADSLLLKSMKNVIH